MDFVHYNAGLIDEGKIDTAIGENGGHDYGCWSRGLSVNDNEIYTVAPASQQRSGSSGKPCTGVYPGPTAPGGENQFAHVPAMPTL